MPREAAQGTRWCFTLNNYTEEEYGGLISTPCKYIVIGREVGEGGTPHLQGFIVFETNKRLRGVRLVSPRAHWELARGSTDQASEYCKKEGNFAERGTKPANRQQQALDQHDKWQDVIRAAKAGTCQDEHPREFIQYNSTISRLYEPNIESIDSYSGMWFYGRPGCGKSRQARNNFPGLYDKLINKWWDGYVDEETVLLDDVGKDHTFLGSFLKRWCDHYPFRAEHKGGSKEIRPKRIIVTSNYLIADIWADDRELVDALERRFTFINFNEGDHFPKPNFDIVE